VSALRHRATEGSLDHGRAETSIAPGFGHRRYIGHTDGYHLNKSAVAMAAGILGFSHFQPHTQRRLNMSAASIQSVRPTRRIGAWTLQGIIAAAFLAAGFAKLAGVPFMVDLFAQIGLGQWFRVVTGVVEVTGAVALLIPGLASIGALWLGGTMVGAVATHLFVLHTSPVPAIVLGLLNAVVVYLRRDELVALLHRVKG
jgi:uncharacterized membrane protein YphA (DoxX/SURF4 family)